MKTDAQASSASRLVRTRDTERASSDPLPAARAALRAAALPRPATVVAAMSGGADSAALALVLVRLAPELRLRVVAAHYDHGIREAASRAAERAVVVRQAERLGLALHEGAAPAGELVRRRRATGRSLEELAREQRYAFLSGVAVRCGAAAVAVGHHLDDHLETILMRALQGSLRGGGIAASSGLVVRPLLGVRRAALRHYVARTGLPIMEDPTNADPRMLRNRIRGLLPDLEAAVPGSAGNLSVLAAGGAAAWRRLAADARRAIPWRYAVDRRLGVHYRVSARAFWSAAAEVREAALYQVWDALVSRGLSGRRNRPRLPRRFLRPLLAKRAPARRLTLAGHGVRLTGEHDWMIAVRHPAASAAPRSER